MVHASNESNELLRISGEVQPVSSRGWLPAPARAVARGYGGRAAQDFGDPTRQNLQRLHRFARQSVRSKRTLLTDFTLSGQVVWKIGAAVGVLFVAFS